MQTGGGGGAGTISLLQSTFAREGVAGLYRGVSAPIVAIAPVFAVCFWGYDMGKRIVRATSSSPNCTPEDPLTITQLTVAGALSAVPTTALMAPSERIKCLLQVQANEVANGGVAKYTSMRDCALQVYKEGGVRSVFKGTYATLLRDVPGSAAYFGMYEWMKREIMKMQGNTSGQLSPVAVPTAGGLAGMANWTVSIPPDVLKSRYQTAPPGKYGGLYDVYREVIREEGYSGLFRGIRPALIRAIPANAACFFGMELSRSLLSSVD